MLPSIYLEVWDETVDNFGKVLVDRLEDSVHRTWDVLFEEDYTLIRRTLIRSIEDDHDNAKYIVCFLLDPGTDIGPCIELMKMWTILGFH